RKGCKVNLRHPKVSPVHLAIVHTGSAAIALDLVTRYGTKLNSLPMEHERLSDADVLTIGPWQFRIEIVNSPPGGPADRAPVDIEPTTATVTLEQVATGRILQPNREVCVIGRRTGCDIAIADRRVSRAHALLIVSSGRPAVFDLYSRNHTLVNGTPVGFHYLANDDMITVGDTQFRVKLSGPTTVDKSGNGRNLAEQKVALGPGDHSSDRVDIGAVEGAQRWAIADSLQRAARKK
ncbi:MAG: FHA domain-containing protein, partial [Phycisphaerae bacterium]